MEGAGLAFWWCVEGHRGQGSSQEPRAVTAEVLRGRLIGDTLWRQVICWLAGWLGD